MPSYPSHGTTAIVLAKMTTWSAGLAADLSCFDAKRRRLGTPDFICGLLPQFGGKNPQPIKGTGDPDSVLKPSAPSLFNGNERAREENQGATSP